MRTRVIAVAAGVSLVVGATAVAQAPEDPRGNFGGGAVAAPPKSLFGSGNAIIALRARSGRRLQIEATIRAGKCLGGDLAADTKIAPDGSFSVEGSQTTDPAPQTEVKTTYKISGTFTSASAIEGTMSATLDQRGSGSKQCESGMVKFGARRPDGATGKTPAPARARYYGTTSQRGVGPRRPIVLRVSGDGLTLSRGLFGEAVTCSDGRKSIGIEGPSTNVKIGRRTGKVSDHEHFTIDEGATKTFVDDRFSGVLGDKGGHGTFSLSDRTLDTVSGRTIQTCESGKVKWKASR